MGSKRSALKQAGPATMRDVARQAGVSVTTVSKVLNHIPYVSKVTQRRVEEAITALGFQPNASAQQLQGGASRIIALDLRQTAQIDPLDRQIDQLMDSSFLFKLLGGIGRVIAAAGYNLLWSMPASLPPGEHARAVARLYQTGRADGIIVAGLSAADPRLTALRACGCPYVVIGNPGDESLSVDSDNIAAGALVARAFLDRGHRILAIAGGGTMMHMRDRLAGYQGVIAAAGATLLPEPDCVGESSFDRGRRQLRCLMALPTPPTAVFACSNLVGLGVLAEAQALGVRIPEQLAVVAFDDEPTCEMSTPPLSSVAQDVAGLGQQATRMLLAELVGEAIPSRRILLPTDLVERWSLGELRHD